MSLPAHVPPPVAPPPAAPAVRLQPGAELEDDDLEQVVGGLERVYMPGIPIAQD